MQFYEIQNALLLNEHRKKELIEILSKLFVSDSYSAVQSNDEANTMIESTAMDMFILGKNEI